ncbi:MAG: hypothetical protein DWQ36_07075 [Acidobacteria bacterium]|nr:MAG: hypothetical protein DWQ36_07075 [Acidobacteriota bacterium]
MLRFRRSRRRVQPGTLALVISAAATLIATASHGAEFVVVSSGDQGDSNPGNGFCATPGMIATCTLRAAIEEANALPGTDTIFIGAGTIAIGEPTLQITEQLVITGAGANHTTLITSGPGWRVFNIGSVVASISHLTIRGAGGASLAGGAIHNFGTLQLSRVWLDQNSAQSCGAIRNDGHLFLLSSTLSHNVAQAGIGGALCINNAATAEVTNSTFYANAASDGGAVALMHPSALLDIRSSTVVDNVDYAPEPWNTSAFLVLDASIHVDKTLIVGRCDYGIELRGATVTSDGGNLQSPVADCLLGAPGDLGGLARSELHLGTFGDYGGLMPLILPGTMSPAVEPPLSAASCPPQDARGQPRVGRCDVGSVERQFDDPESGPQFEDGFESGDTAAWSQTVP